MTHRKDISLDPKATHYCEVCGLTMKARDELECSVTDGDLCVPKRREKAPAQAASKKPTVVCSTCKDTHRMTLHLDNGDEQTVMCTRCPRPCQECRAGGNGPFCEVTPCACPCHHPEPSDPEIGAKLAARSELAEARGAYAAAERALNAARGRLSKARATAKKLGLDV